MKSRRLILIFGMISSAVLVCAQRPPMDLTLSPAPVVATEVPLSKGLGQIGAMIREGYVLFGVEQRLKKHQPPKINLHLKPNSTLRDAFRQIFSQLREYRFYVVSEHIYPTGARQDPDDVLNAHVARFDIVARPGSVLSRPEDFIPELQERLHPKSATTHQPSGRLGPGLEGTEAPVNLHLRDVTVRQILNSVTEEWEKSAENNDMPVGWLYSYDPEAIVEKHVWNFQWSLPDGWKKWRN
jgi:hypothetical protein